MAHYIGNVPSAGEFKHLDSIASQFNGGSVTFALQFNSVSQSVGDATQLIVSLNGIIQEPLTAYTLGTGGSNITFASAPASGDTCFIVMLGGVGNTTTPSDNSVTTAKIAAGAVTSSKISIDGDISFPDNDKLILGTGSDLQIYHNSSNNNSYISESGAGSLFIQGANIILEDPSTGADGVVVRPNAEVELYYQGSEKLATTNTGIDVTGTVVTDGLTVNSGTTNTTATFQSTDAGAYINFTDTTGTSGIGNDTVYLYLDADKDNVVADSQIRLRVDGSTKLTVKDSGNVGIGETGPFTKFHAKDTLWSSGSPYGTVALIEGNNVIDNNWGHLVITDTTTSNGNGGSIRFATGAANALNPFSGIQGTAEGISWGGIGFETRPQGGTATRRMTIDSTGNVGVGTSAPSIKLEVAGTTKAEQYLLDTVAKDISDTAVDVFIYDTRKDSDGGAWRKRTQHTSWYNETLNTATRGSRKEFPAVAVIVAETNQVTIYDGDDPDMPMWMVFNDASNYFLNQPTVSAVTMLNGKLAVTGTATNHTSLAIGDFVSEFCQIIRSNYDGDATGLVNRNQSFWSSDKGNTRIVSNVVNDVAMTVLPNAPNDAATGLPVPTIAVATAGGVSVIKDDGTVVDLKTTNTYTGANKIKFTKENKLAFSAQNSGGQQTYYNYVVDSIPSSDETFSNWRGNSERVYETLVSTIQYSDVVLNPITYTNSGANVVDATPTDYGLAAGFNSRLTAILETSEINDKNAGAYITSSYNTGWMNGDIKLATLSDTDDTDVTGSELIDQASDLEDTIGEWTLGVGTASISNASQFHYLQIKPNGSFLPVGRYVITFTVASGGTTYGLYSNAENGYLTGALSSGNYVVQLNQTSATELKFVVAATNSVSITNLSVRLLAEEDRSVNGNGLQVFGTVTKSAVATGADLVSYRSSGGSYLGQPSAGNLVLTDDFSVTWWQKHDTVAGIYEGWQIAENDITGASNYSKVVISAMHEVSSAQYLIRGNSVTGASVSNGIDSGSWTCLTLTKQGSTIKLYTNGELSVTTTGTTSTPSNPYSLEILRWSYATTRYYTANSELSLFRTSNTVPSAEQIKKIYEDEKVLFQENAQATLYGSSDSVTALAYDDSTNLLHVGTSAGRSVFQGLRRIDNTTDAVGAAISASNGMVAED